MTLVIMVLSGYSIMPFAHNVKAYQQQVISITQM